MIRTNVLGVIYGMRAAGEQLMRQRSGGGIVNISSIVGEFPDPGGGAYAASKAAVDLLSRTGYRELRDHGIHVVNVKPALTDTEFSATARGVQRRMGGDPPEKVARWVAEALESGSANHRVQVGFTHVCHKHRPRPASLDGATIRPTGCLQTTRTPC